MTTPISFAKLSPNDRLMIIDGLAGGTTTITAVDIHLEEEVIYYLDKNGAESFALFEEVIKKL